MGILLLVLGLATLGVACGSSGGAGPRDGGAATDAADADRDTAARSDAGTLPATLGPAARPARLSVPTAHDGVTPLPVVVLLHGYTASAMVQDIYFGLSRAARAEGFYLILPDGTVDASGNRFWNATPACCDFAGSGVDDVGYIVGLVDELATLAPVAPGQVFLMGHSNGGFMSYRLACEHADRFAAFMSLAGSDFPLATDCVPSQPVSVLQVHGDADATIGYLGGPMGAYPSAPDVVARWATRAGCSGPPTMGAALDIDSGLPGAETTPLRYTAGCAPGVEAELWTIGGGGHIPALARDFSVRVLGWLRAHGR